jgi:hypothetical protein
VSSAGSVHWCQDDRAHEVRSGGPLARNMHSGQTLTLANFQEADQIWVGAIILSLIRFRCRAR